MHSARVASEVAYITMLTLVCLDQFLCIFQLLFGMLSPPVVLEILLVVERHFTGVTFVKKA